MINVLIVGINGKMGKRVYSLLKDTKNRVVCGVDKNITGDFDCPVYKSFDEVRENVDAVIDFSSASFIDEVLRFSKDNPCRLVECTTGFSKEQQEKIFEASKDIPLFFASNTSLGVFLTAKICKELSLMLPDFNIEIVEAHHKNKLDAPSGTALLIKDALLRCSRNDVPVHSLRGGSVVGEHKVIFMGENEVITVSHRAENKDLFALGAINAVEFLSDKENGFYEMKDLLNQ